MTTLVLILFVLQGTDYKYNFLTLTLTENKHLTVFVELNDAFFHLIWHAGDG